MVISRSIRLTNANSVNQRKLQQQQDSLYTQACPAQELEQDSPAQELEQDAQGSRQQTVTQVLLAHRPAQELELDAPNLKGHKQVCPSKRQEQDSPAQEPEQDALGSRQQPVTQVLLAHRPAQELELDAPNSKGHKQVCPSTRQEQDSPAQELEQDALGSRQRTVTQALQAYR